LTRYLAVAALAVVLSVPLDAQAPAVVAAAAPPPQPEVGTPGGFAGFVHDVGGDYVHFLSLETAKWLTAGGVETIAVHQADEWIRQETQEGQAVLLSQTAGQTYGNLSLQLPLAVGWWVAGHSTGSARAAEAGRDLLRAQISALSWNYAVKYAVGRTRPNGDPRSFPSGHSAASFATAMVLQEHYGWKLGVPFFAIAAYTATSRIVDNKHWASDVTFAAFMGMASGRTVTMHLRRAPVAISPVATRGGGGVMVTVGDRR
jgi:membrane-associated phospholipid phosphatase